MSPSDEPLGAARQDRILEARAADQQDRAEIALDVRQPFAQAGRRPRHEGNHAAAAAWPCDCDAGASAARSNTIISAAEFIWLLWHAGLDWANDHATPSRRDLAPDDQPSSRLFRLPRMAPVLARAEGRRAASSGRGAAAAMPGLPRDRGRARSALRRMLARDPLHRGAALRRAADGRSSSTPGRRRCAAIARREPPAYARARSVMVYDDESRDLILGFKRGDRLEGAPAFGSWMARSGRALDRRRRSRRARPPAPHAGSFPGASIRRLSWPWRSAGRQGLPVLPDALMRTRATPSQAGLSRSGALQKRPRRVRDQAPAKSGAQGRRIVLIDDVMTTGATVEGCSRALLKAGAASVSALTLARVVHGL